MVSLVDIEHRRFTYLLIHQVQVLVFSAIQNFPVVTQQLLEGKTISIHLIDGSVIVISNMNGETVLSLRLSFRNNQIDYLAPIPFI